MQDFHISKNLDGLRLNPCAWNQNIHIQNWSRSCLEYCCWTGVFDYDVKVRGNTFRVCSDSCGQSIRVSAMVRDDCSVYLHVACNRGNSLKAHRGVGNRWTRLSKRESNCFIASWTLSCYKRNRVRLWSYPYLDCLCRWNRSRESQGGNGTTSNYVETESLLRHSCWEVWWVYCKNKRMCA